MRLLLQVWVMSDDMGWGEPGAHLSVDGPQRPADLNPQPRRLCKVRSLFAHFLL
jgi:hypothetical protein